MEPYNKDGRFFLSLFSDEQVAVITSRSSSRYQHVSAILILYRNIAPKWFFVKFGKAITRISLDDLCIEGEKEYVRLVATSGELLVFKRMKEMAEKLTLLFSGYTIHGS